MMENRDEIDETIDRTENGSPETGGLPAEEVGETPEEENGNEEENGEFGVLGKILHGVAKTFLVLVLIFAAILALGLGTCFLATLLF